MALLHSLWQGAALGLVVALLLQLLRQQAALVRYRLAALALATLAGLLVVTFGYYYLAPAAGGHASAPLAATADPGAAGVAKALLSNAVGHEVAGLRKTARQHLEPHLPLVAGLWLLGFGAMVLRLLLAAAQVRRLRRTRLRAVPTAWQHRLDDLARRAGLARPVQVLMSGLVSSPLVIGSIKPLILLPLGLLSGLAPAEVDMLLAHELAHIVRRDYLFNLLQAVAETVFFYHPAVWFLSGVLHAEREHCCDDLATQLTGSPRQLAHALAALAELTYQAPAVPRLALAASGRGGTLLHRVRRLARPRPLKAAGFWPASVVLLGSGLLLAAMLLTARAAPPHRTSHTETHTVRISTTRNQPDDAPPTGRAPLAASDAALLALFQAQLCADGLLPDTTHYALALTSSQFLINGQPQPASLLPRYHGLYEAATGYRLTATTTYRSEKAVQHQERQLTPVPAR